MPIKINKAFVLERRFRPPVPELHWWETQLLQAIVDHVIVARADSESGITFGELVDELCWNIRENVERSERKRRWYEEEPTRPSADAP